MKVERRDGDHGPAVTHPIVKLVPSLDSTEREAAPLLVSIVIMSVLLSNEPNPIGPVILPIVAKQVLGCFVWSSPKDTVLKSAKGRIPPL